VAEASGAYQAEGRARELSAMSREEISKLVSQMEAEMRAAARELEFERAATLRDEIQQVRLRVLEEDASVVVERAAEKAAAAGDVALAGEATAKPTERVAALRSGNRRGRRPGSGQAASLAVTSVEVLPAEEEPAASLDERPDEGADGTAADWLPGIRDEHEGDDAGWMARWLDRQTWDRRVTPNVIRRTGERPKRRR
jgi:UvrB/uvrC motif